MRERTKALIALCRASWSEVAANRPEGRPVECLSDEAIAHARELAELGFGTLTFTANRRGRFFADFPGDTK